jgi:predicted lactoylglutathione lyase
MSNLINISPVLPVGDIKKEVDFFSSLGFSSIYDSLQYSDQLDYSVLQRDSQSIHLQWFEEGTFQGQQMKIWVTDIALVEQELQAKKVVIHKNYDTPWNTHEIGVYSPSRHAILFVEDID